MQASKKRKFHLVDDQDPPGSGNCDDVDVGSVDLTDDFDVGSVDLISRLPDAVLGSIVSLLPTKEGARTQVISRRWRPLWRSAPLNLEVDYEPKNKDLIPKILSEHPGPARRFSVRVFTHSRNKIEGWLSSQTLDSLQEFEVTYTFWSDMKKECVRPLSVFHFSPTLRVAKFHGFHFPNLIAQLSLKFPCLKQLTLHKVTISEDVFQSMLFGCSALESLELKDNWGIGRLCISSQTLRSLAFCADQWSGGVFLQELVIEDAPCLERLLPLDHRGETVIIRIICAPKLEILGMLSENISEFHLGSSIIQFLSPPTYSQEVMNNVRNYDPLDPIECLELHLKKVVLKNYDGTKSSSIDFARFFVLNTKGLKEMKITLPYHRQHGWFANQLSLLRVRSRASRDARIEMRCGTNDFFTHNRHTHDLSMDDPFDLPSIGCSKCKEKGLGDAIYQI